MTVYRIRHKETGLYSRGSAPPSWNKVGKVWRNKSALGNHLALQKTCNEKHESRSYSMVPNPEMKNWEIIEYEVTEAPGALFNAWEYYVERKRK